MSTAIIMLPLSPSMIEGDLVRWLKKEGDNIEAGDVIAEIETEKALVDCEAPTAGVLGKILIADGTKNVKVGSTLGWLLKAGEQVPESTETSAIEADAPMYRDPSVDSSDSPALQGAVEPAARINRLGGRVPSSPLARRLAQQHGLSLDSIHGSGPNGRIVRVDITSALRETPQLATQEMLVGEQKSATNLAPSASGMSDEYEDIPHTGTRRVIARRLSESKREIPHFYLTIECQLNALLALRAQINDIWPDEKVSLNDFIVRAAAIALTRVPAVNASWTETAIRRWKSVDISVAVATPTGLITPVVRQADKKTVRTLSREIKNLVARAQEGRLKPAEYTGGGFSISNLGMYGIREFAAIINPPQACILAVGAAEQRAVVRDGTVVVAQMMTCTLSVDHRVVDGSVGAQCLAVFKKLIEQPLTMLE